MTDPVCASSTTVISTAASVKSVYFVSVAASTVAVHVSSASAVQSSAGAVPSAECWILKDDCDGDSTFEVYGMNDWARDGGSSLHKQMNGCGILTG